MLAHLMLTIERDLIIGKLEKEVERLQDSNRDLETRLAQVSAEVRLCRKTHAGYDKVSCCDGGGGLFPANACAAALD